MFGERVEEVRESRWALPAFQDAALSSSQGAGATGAPQLAIRTSSHNESFEKRPELWESTWD